MKRVAFITAIVALAAPAAFAVDFPLTAKTMDKTQALSLSGIQGNIAMWMTQRPSELKAEPETVCEFPLYAEAGTMQSPDSARRIFMRLDKSSADAGTYDRLIVDLNGNGDLTDDPALKSEDAQDQGSYEQAIFGPVEFKQADQGNRTCAIAVQSMIYNKVLIGRRQMNVGTVIMRPAVLYEAEVELNGRKERIALIDGNVDLRLGEPVRVPAVNLTDGAGYWTFSAGDVILRNCGDSGKIAGSLANADSEPLASVVYFGGAPYDLRVAGDMSSLSLDPYSGAVGELTLPDSGQLKAVTLGRKVDGQLWESLTVRPEGQTAKVPEGTYGLHSTVVQAAEGKDRWTVQGTKSQPGALFEISAGKKAELKAGGPLKLNLVAQPDYGAPSGGGLLGALAGALQSKGISAVNINVETLGAGGEKYTAYVRNGQTLQPPQFKVLDQSGKELSSGQLEYG